MQKNKFDIYVPVEPVDIAQRVICCDDAKVNCVELRFSNNDEPQAIVVTGELNEMTKLIGKSIKECVAKEQRIAVLERALELACEDVGIVKVITKVLTDDKTTATVDDVAKYYIDQAEKELEEEK